MDTDELLELMSFLDKGSNMFGSLTEDVRARIFAVVDNPTQETWNNAYSVIVKGSDPNRMPRTLWHILNNHAPYGTFVRDSATTWSEIPTREQILTALKEVLS